MYNWWMDTSFYQTDISNLKLDMVNKMYLFIVTFFSCNGIYWRNGTIKEEKTRPLSSHFILFVSQLVCIDHLIIKILRSIQIKKNHTLLIFVFIFLTFLCIIFSKYRYSENNIGIKKMIKKSMTEIH